MFIKLLAAGGEIMSWKNQYITSVADVGNFIRNAIHEKNKKLSVQTLYGPKKLIVSVKDNRHSVGGMVYFFEEPKITSFTVGPKLRRLQGEAADIMLKAVVCLALSADAKKLQMSSRITIDKAQLKAWGFMTEHRGRNFFLKDSDSLKQLESRVGVIPDAGGRVPKVYSVNVPKVNLCQLTL